MRMFPNLRQLGLVLIVCSMAATLATSGAATAARSAIAGNAVRAPYVQAAWPAPSNAWSRTLAGVLPQSPSPGLRPATVSSFYSLRSSVLPVRTSTGRRIGLSIVIEGEVMGHQFTGPSNVDVSLISGSFTENLPSEVHEWTLNHLSTTTSGSTTKGTLTVDTGATIRPYGHIALSFSQTSRKPAACASGSSTTLTGSLSATISFHTLSAAWGDAGTKGVTVTFPGKTTITIDRGCTHTTTARPCQTGEQWQTPEISTEQNGKTVRDAFIAGGEIPNAKGKIVGAIAAGRFTFLTNPEGERQDLLIDVTSLQKYDAIANTLQVKAFRGPALLFTGGAILTGQGQPSTANPEPCTTAQGKAMQDSTSYSATWTNDSGSPLIAHLSWSGNITVPSSAIDDEGGIDVLTITP